MYKPEYLVHTRFCEQPSYFGDLFYLETKHSALMVVLYLMVDMWDYLKKSTGLLLQWQKEWF